MCAKGRHITLLLLQALQNWQLGLLVSLCLLFGICPHCPRMLLFLTPNSFFVFCSLRRAVSRCKHCSKESQVLGLSHIQSSWEQFPGQRCCVLSRVQNQHWTMGHCVSPDARQSEVFPVSARKSEPSQERGSFWRKGLNRELQIQKKR